MSPEQARDEAMTQIIDAGGSIISVEPLAHPDSLETICAYRVTAGASDLDILTAVKSVRAETRVQMDGLISWMEVDYESIDS